MAGRRLPVPPAGRTDADIVARANTGAAGTSDRILDAAGLCFAAQGVLRTSLGDVARAAGFSRPTVYRYFEDRDALRIAFVHRAARRLGSQVTDEVTGIADPAERLVRGVLLSLAAVRADPVLSAWFSPDNAGIASRLAGSSSVIGELAMSLVPGAHEDERGARAAWLVRVVVSLLLQPGPDTETERSAVESFVVPVVVAPATGGARTG